MYPISLTGSVAHPVKALIAKPRWVFYVLAVLGYACGGSDKGGLEPPAPATNIAIHLGNNQSAAPGASVTIPPAVKVTDANANPVADVQVTFAVASGGGSITGESSRTDASGVATVGSWTLGPAAGTHTLTATAAGLSGSPITFNATATAPGERGSFQSLDGANAYTCGLTVEGTAHCWGFNVSGMLGDGTTTDRVSPVAVEGGLRFTSLTTGAFHACGLTSEGSAYCWGFNQVGMLGDGTTTQHLTPVTVSGGLSFRSLTAGHGHTCALTTAGVAYCWGHNVDGQLGDGTTTDRLSPTPVAGGLTFQTIDAGADHTCGVAPSGAAYCWGANNNGMLGDGSTDQRLTPVVVSGGLAFQSVSGGFDHSCGLTVAGAAYCWGLNANGQLGDGTQTDRLTPGAVAKGLTFRSLAAGYNHNCGVTTNDDAYCWGFGIHGQIGAELFGVSIPSPELVVGDLAFASVTAGISHSCGLTTASVAYCWGYNGKGGLGDGSTTDRLSPQPVNWP